MIKPLTDLFAEKLESRYGLYPEDINGIPATLNSEQDVDDELDRLEQKFGLDRIDQFPYSL